MRARAEARAVTTTLARASRVVNHKNCIPILEHVRIAATDDGLVFTTTDLDAEFTATVAAEIDEKGATTVPAATLASAAKLAGDGTAEFSLKGDELKFSVPGQTVWLATLPYEDFPDITGVEDGCTFLLPAKDVEAMLRRTAFSMDTGEARVYLRGVFLRVDEGQLVAVSTNGHVLTELSFPLPEGAGGLPSIILPAAAAKAALALIDPSSDHIEISADDRKLSFRQFNWVFTTRLVDAKFPAYRHMITEDDPHPAVLSAVDIGVAVGCAELAATGETPSVRIIIEGDEAVVTPNQRELHNAEAKMPTVYDGPKKILAIQPRHITSIIAASGWDNLHLHMPAPGAPFKFVNPHDEGAVFVAAGIIAN